MKTGIFVVGALREYRLCYKSWLATNPYPDADWHMMTWSTTSDSFKNEPGDQYLADLGPVLYSNRKDLIRFNSLHVFDEESSYPYANVPGNYMYRAGKGPWFWNKIHEMFGTAYDRYVIMRPDLFLWARKGVENPWPVGKDIKKHVLNMGKAQDQFFIVTQDGLRTLATTWLHMQRHPNLYMDPHKYLDDVFSMHESYDDTTLLNNFNIFIARPNSRHLGYHQMSADVAQGALDATVEWWESITNGKYEGPRALL
jgi:hypothetical protein